MSVPAVAFAISASWAANADVAVITTAGEWWSPATPACAGPAAQPVSMAAARKPERARSTRADTRKEGGIGSYLRGDKGGSGRPAAPAITPGIHRTATVPSPNRNISEPGPVARHTARQPCRSPCIRRVVDVGRRRSSAATSHHQRGGEGADDPPVVALVDERLDLDEHGLAGFRVGHRPTVRVGPLELRVPTSRVALVPAVAMDRRLCELCRGNDLIDERRNKLLMCRDRVVRTRQSMAAEHVMDLVEEPTVSGRSDLVERDQRQVPAGSEQGRRSRHPRLGRHPVVARCRHHSVERARSEVDVLEGPYDDVDGREVAGENGCQLGTQLDRSHAGASGNESLRSLAFARTDLDHDW